MRVAIDCRTLQASPLGGIGRALAAVLPHLAGSASLDLLVDGRRRELQAIPAGACMHSLRAPLSGRDAVWLQLAAPRWLRRYPGLFHAPFYGLPYYQPVPMVVTIWDLSFEFAPAWFGRTSRLTFRRQARWGARTARRILTGSEHVRTMILERYARYGVTEERVVVTPLPVDPRFFTARDLRGRIHERLGLPASYVVTLGGAPRRGLEMAVGAWGNACRAIGAGREELPLVVVGTEIAPPERGVVNAGILNDEDWAALLAGARAFCYATRYEGYGLPAVEAAAVGTPVVCARVGSLPEVLGDAAGWADAPDPESLGAALASVLGDEGRARDLTAAGLARARALPTAAETAAGTLKAYRDALAS